MTDVQSDLAELDAALQSLRQLMESAPDDEAIALIANLRTLVHVLEDEPWPIN
jgi:hypothetical protein